MGVERTLASPRNVFEIRRRGKHFLPFSRLKRIGDRCYGAAVHTGDRMTERDRFNAFLHDRPVDRIPDFEFWFWDATLARWVGEGMPAELAGGDRRKLCEYFGMDFIDGLPIRTRFVREPRQTVIAESDDTVTVLSELGETIVTFKPGRGESIPTHLSYAIRTHDDWRRVRDEFLPLDVAARLPPNWAEVEARCSGSRDFILNTPQMGFYGILRNWMGVEEISVAFAEDPDWIAEMMDHLLDIYLRVSRFIVDRGIRPDLSGWWEDMCYNHGPLISPAMFREFLVPRYRQVTDFWRAHGVDRAVVDSDGNIHALAPLWIEAGIQILLPCEAAHTDTLRLRRENPDAFLMGGVDKRALARGRAAIDAELERVRRIMDFGRFMPHVDHLVPPDVPLADYLYYRERKCALLER